MNRLKAKTTATLLIAIFIISAFTLAVNANPGTALIIEGDATAEWSDKESYSGDYSVELTAGIVDWVDWAGVQIPVDELLTDMSSTHADHGFYYKTDGTTSQTPAIAFVFEDVDDVDGETWKLVEYFTSLDTTVTTWTSEVLKAELFLMKGSTNLGTAEYWSTSGWISDMGAGFVHQDLSAWQLADVGGSTLGSRTVDCVEVSIGARTGTVYIDDITINGETYDLELPPTPSNKREALRDKGVPGKGIDKAPGLDKPIPNDNFAKGRGPQNGPNEPQGHAHGYHKDKGKP